MTQKDKERYMNSAHAMQTGVQSMMEIYQKDLTLKSLRVGINSALVDSYALAKLLIDKGIISQDEYEKYLADEMEEEVKRYKERFKEFTGADVTLL